MYQFAFNRSSGDYEWDYSSFAQLAISGMLANCVSSDVAMLYEGVD